MEGSYAVGASSIYVPIIKPDNDDPDERGIEHPDFIFLGPNEFIFPGQPEMLDYDVGALIEFPVVPAPPAADIVNLRVAAINPSGLCPDAEITLYNDYFSLSPCRIYQGHTAMNAPYRGLIYVLGVKTSNYYIQSSKGTARIVSASMGETARSAGNKTWMCGEASVGGRGKNRVNNRFWISPSKDSLTIELKPVQGDYPLICGVSLDGDGTRYWLDIHQRFSTDPTMDLFPTIGGQYSYSLSFDGSGYSAFVTENLGHAGTFTLWAVDDSSSKFFFNTDYTISHFDSSVVIQEAIGPNGASVIRFDTLNAAMERAMILSSPYPVMTAGLDEGAMQGDETHCLAVYPPMGLVGHNRLVIAYADNDIEGGEGIYGEETSLRIHWDESSSQWELVGGSVDTVYNLVSASVSEWGVYGTFTTERSGVDDGTQGLLIPDRFELQQNYPNPFNPITAVKYELPRECYVILTIYNILGQKVATLVDGEQKAGYKTVRSDAGLRSSGIYFYRLKTSDFVQTRKMILLR